MRTPFSPVERAIEALSQGRVIIVVDSEEREDEGDFVVAAQFVTPRIIHFLITHGRGQLCMPVLPEVVERLELKSMVPPSRVGEQPRFAVPIDHRTCKSGISPLERAYTIRAVVDARNTADDFVRPGHIFPLIAEPNGIFSRQGHTEASIDLMLYAGLSPVAVLCEICSADGLHTAERTELFDIAKRFGLEIITIDALLEFRRQNPDRRDLRRNLVAPAAPLSVKA